MKVAEEAVVLVGMAVPLLLLEAPAVVAEEVLVVMVAMPHFQLIFPVAAAVVAVELDPALLQVVLLIWVMEVPIRVQVPMAVGMVSQSPVVQEEGEILEGVMQEVAVVAVPEVVGEEVLDLTETCLLAL